MSFLSDEEQDTFHIQRMILHVVASRKEAAFEAQGELQLQQLPFFESRIFEEAGSPVHRFMERSTVKPILERMASNEDAFEAGAQELSALFFDAHVQTATAGAFFVFELSDGGGETKLYALLKYDYREAVELAQEKGRNVLRAIVQAFIKDRRALQKFCVVRVREGTADPMVSASDRMKEAPDLTDYFERYLGVERTRSSQELSSRLAEALRGALQELREHLPERDVPSAIAQAKVALAGRATVTNDDVVDAVLHAAGRPADEKTRLKIERTTRRRLKGRDLDNVEFRPDRRSLQVKPRSVVRTVEDVRLEFPGEELGRSVVRRPLPNGGSTFTITTERPLLEDGTRIQKLGGGA